MRKYIIVLILSKLLIFFSFPVAADTLFLKNGMKLESEKIWEEGNEIKCYINGLVVGFAAGEVERIEKKPVVPPKDIAADDLQKSELGLSAMKQHLDGIKQNLDREYQTLIEEFAQLEKDKKLLKPGVDTPEYDQRITRFNQNVETYEHKRRIFDKEIQAYLAQLKKDNARVLLDQEELSKIIGSWLNHPIDEFIDQWGYPDTIINMPDDIRQYSFLVEIAPSGSHKIIFETNPSGEIVSFRTAPLKSNDKLP